MGGETGRWGDEEWKIERKGEGERTDREDKENTEQKLEDPSSICSILLYFFDSPQPTCFSTHVLKILHLINARPKYCS